MPLGPHLRRDRPPRLRQDPRPAHPSAPRRPRRSSGHPHQDRRPAPHPHRPQPEPAPMPGPRPVRPGRRSARTGLGSDHRLRRPVGRRTAGQSLHQRHYPQLHQRRLRRLSSPLLRRRSGQSRRLLPPRRRSRRARARPRPALGHQPPRHRRTRRHPARTPPRRTPLAGTVARRAPRRRAHRRQHHHHRPAIDGAVLPTRDPDRASPALDDHPPTSPRSSATRAPSTYSAAKTPTPAPPR